MFTERISPSGLTFDELRKQVWALPPKGHPSGTAPYRRYEEGLLRPDKSPDSDPNGKIEVYSTTLESYGLDPLPYFEEPVESPLRTPEYGKSFPLIMMTGRRSPVLFHSEHRQIPWLREIDPDPIVESIRNSPSSRYRGWKLGLDRGKARPSKEKGKTHSYRSPANGHGPPRMVVT